MSKPALQLTRADTVRQRRVQIKHRSPVVTRVQRTGSASRTQVPQKPVRRYQAMAVTAVQPGHVTMPKIKLGWRLLSGVLVLLIGAALYLLGASPLFFVTVAEVTGNQRISADEVNNVLGISGYSVFFLTPETLEQNLLTTFSDIDSASVYVGLPARVTVTIIERQPVIAWVQGSEVLWVDADGMAFQPRGDVAGLVTVAATARPPMPLADPNASAAVQPFLSQDLVRAVLSFASHIPAGTFIQYDPQYGFGWNDPRGWVAYFGLHTGDLAMKLRIYETLVNSLTQRGIRPVLISVAYTDAPFYRLEP